jgi:hypothetical protein
MSTLTFDTFKYVDRLKVAGVSEAQAKAEMEALQTAFNEAFDVRELATRQDINALRQDIKTLELATKANIEAIKSELIKWVAGLLIAQGAIVAALVKLL